MAKSTIVMVLLLGVVCSSFAQQPISPKFTPANIDAILSNDRVLTNYIKCLLGEQQCTRDGRSIKDLLPDIIQNNCSKCDNTQRMNSMKVINYVRTHRPQDWQKLIRKYDPQGLHIQQLNSGKF
ncbi:ejaculatory bulb-specific protein 3-like [Sitodiplosis mosellana]|uniref:ejaculatory bulb-specific protein 3-like n=1 Tax=Sitodiplosis mosellana TaxID=263140 RepID=UPI0024452DFA|nr:ejaculatory bulb-specific protein 3-like [Sitodiplosis mosellana]